eukprot:1158696-Pelagomonas_calceolata.AAC.3
MVIDWPGAPRALAKQVATWQITAEIVKEVRPSKSCPRGASTGRQAASEHPVHLGAALIRPNAFLQRHCLNRHLFFIERKDLKQTALQANTATALKST